MKREGNKMKENQVKKLVMAAMCVADGIPYDSECGKYFFAYAHSGIDLRSALWMAVWADMWDFSACIIQSVYRNASGCNPSGNAL